MLYTAETIAHSSKCSSSASQCVYLALLNNLPNGYKPLQSNRFMFEISLVNVPNTGLPVNLSTKNSGGSTPILFLLM